VYIHFKRPEVNARSELVQSSLAIALAGVPLPGQIASQALAFDAGALDFNVNVDEFQLFLSY
jgi:hypothetical protein